LIRRGSDVPAFGYVQPEKEVRMGLLDWIRGKPRDPQQERVEARDAAGDRPDDLGSAETGEEVEEAMKIRRDEEAARHQGI
jgi:hypothetical protein